MTNILQYLCGTIFHHKLTYHNGYKCKICGKEYNEYGFIKYNEKRD